MFMNSGPSKGGHFGGSAQTGGYNHNHAGAMAHAAAARLQMAKQLGGAGPAIGATPSVSPTPAMGATAPTSPTPAQHDYRAHVAAHAASMGAPAGVPDIHGAIDAMAQKGQFTPFQAQALKAHQGPLQGPQGAQTVQKIAQQVVQNHRGMA
jgi:hypothetical protein